MATNSETEQLIEHVKAYPVLYDGTHPDYFKPKNYVWDGIAQMLDQDADRIKKMWTNLKKAYIRHQRAQNDPLCNSSSKHWPYAKHMEFFNPLSRSVLSQDTEDEGSGDEGGHSTVVAEINVSEMQNSMDDMDSMDDARRSTRIKKRKELGKFTSYSEGTEKNYKNELFDMYDDEQQPNKRPKRNSTAASPKKNPLISTPKIAVKGNAQPRDPVRQSNDEMPYLTPVDGCEDESIPAPTPAPVPTPTPAPVRPKETTPAPTETKSCVKCKTGGDTRSIYDDRINFTSMELIFLSYAKTLDTFSVERRVLAKMKIADVIMKEELLGANR